MYDLVVVTVVETTVEAVVSGVEGGGASDSKGTKRMKAEPH
jgi:hypothetical protein